MTILKVIGPFYGEIPAEHFTNLDRGGNLSGYWIRRTKAPPRPE